MMSPSTDANANNGNASRYWLFNIQKFADDTTFHGCRYICGTFGNYCIRKLLWLAVLLTAFGLFGFMLSGNVKKLMDRPISVDITNTYISSLAFPAVTVCNENRYRMTALFQTGLYDLINIVEGGQQLNETRYGRYNYRPQLCNHNQIAVHSQHLVNVSLKTCMFLCNNNKVDYCSGIFWNRLAGECWWTSYTGDNVDSSANCTDPTLTWMFFRRHRLSHTDPVYCDMERFNYCPILLTSVTCIESFQFATATDSNVFGLTDVSLGRGDGTVLYLVSKTDTNSEESCAEVTTEYMTTAGKCLMLFYQWLNSGTLSIYIRNEEHVIKLVTTKTSSNAQATPWQRLFVTLPSDSGLHQIIIRGARQHNDFFSSSTVTTGIVLDDFSVRPCADFQRNCLLSAWGMEYLGSVNQGETGEKCQPWILSILSADLALALLHVNSEVHYYSSVNDNQCRNIDSDPNGPWCYNVLQQKMYCDIPHCNCPNGWYSCQDSGHCITRTMLCDGINQCSDGSDENLDSCENMTSVACQFVNTFLCGYRGLFGMETLWYYDTLLKEAVISTDWQSQVTSSLSSAFVSPISQQAVTITYHMFDYGNTEPSLSFYLLRDGRILTKPTKFSVSTDCDYYYKQCEMQVDVCIPPGFSVAILPTLPSVGSQPSYAAYTAHIQDSCSTLVYDAMYMNTSISCDFTSSNQCGYWSFNDHDLYKWQLTYKDTLTYGCNFIYNDLTGTIFPPTTYDTDECNYVINLMPNATLTLNVEEYLCSSNSQLHVVSGGKVLNQTIPTSSNVCVYRNWSMIITNSSQVNIYSYSYSIDLFKIHYSIASSTTPPIAIRPMVYAASLKASTLDYVNPRAILTSGMQTISSASCVQFSLLHASGAAFGIRVPECVLTAPDDNGLLLNVTDRGLGDSWHMFWLPLDVPAGYNNTCQALLQFELVYDLSFGTRINTAVSKVLLHNSTCLDIVPPARSVACNFTDINQCGYRDASGSSVRWKRKSITNADLYSTVYIYSSAFFNLELSSLLWYTTATAAPSLITQITTIKYSPASKPSLTVNVYWPHYSQDNHVNFMAATDDGLLRSDKWSCTVPSTLAFPTININASCQVENTPGETVGEHTVLPRSDITNTDSSALYIMQFPNTERIQLTSDIIQCVQCTTYLGISSVDSTEFCLTATDDEPCSNDVHDESSCHALNCCYNDLLNKCLPSILLTDQEVSNMAMSVSLPVNQQTEARLVSPVFATKLQVCLSFLVYFNVTEATTLTIGYTKNVTAEYQSEFSYTAYGVLQYPFNSSLFEVGENMRLLRIRLNMNIADGYRLVFIASGGGGDVVIWDVKEDVQPCQDSKFLTYAVPIAVNATASSTAPQPLPAANDLLRPEDLPGLRDNVNFVNNNNQTISAMLKAFNNMSVTDLEKTAGTSWNSMIIECSWDNINCSNSTSWITDRLTDMGLCFTFNLNASLNSSSAGSQHGLRLLLYLSDYEQIDGLVEFSGLKVFMFDPTNQVELMNEVSYAVSPGTATEIKLSVTSNSFLSAPYSDPSCVSDPIYSHTSCVQECQMQALVDKCNCTNAYMSAANHSHCSVGQYLACAWNPLVGSQEQQCRVACRQECSINTYMPILSFSQLSSSATNTLLNLNRDKMKQSYSDALLLSERLNHNSIIATDLISIYSDTDTLLKFFQQSIQQLTLFNSGLQMFSQLIAADLNLLFNFVQSFSITYNNTYMEIRQKAAFYISTTTNQLRDTVFEINLSPTSFSTFYEAQTFYSGLFPMLSTSIMNIRHAVSYLTQVQVTVDCNEIATFYSNYQYFECDSIMQQYLDWFSNLLPVLEYVLLNVSRWLHDNEEQIMTTSHDKMLEILGATNNGPETDYPGLVALLDCMECIEIINQTIDYGIFHPSSAATALTCLSEYETQLTSTLASLQIAEQYPVLSISPLLLDAGNRLIDGRSNFSYLIDSYFSGNVSGLQLASQATTLLKDLAADVQIIQQEVTSLSNEWTDALNASQGDVLSLYDKVLSNVIDLGWYLTNYTSLFSVASSMKIWLKPAIVTEPEVKIVFGRQNAKNVEMNVLSQLKNDAYDTFTIYAVLNDIATGFIRKLEIVANTTRDMTGNWTSDRTQITTDIETYLANFNMDAIFVKKNFIQLNIYYDQLMVQSTAQSPAYDLIQFFSDMGGLLGLFLGGSVISTFEIFDLIVSNVILLATGRAFGGKKVAKSQAHDALPMQRPEVWDHRATQRPQGRIHASDRPTQAWQENAGKNDNPIAWDQNFIVMPMQEVLY